MIMKEINAELTTKGRMMLVEIILNNFWRKLPEAPRYKDFNKEIKIRKKECVEDILRFERGMSHLHLHSKTTNKQVVYSFLTILATVTDVLVDTPLAAIVEGDPTKDGVIIGWKFYKEEDLGPALGIKEKEDLTKVIATKQESDNEKN